MQVNFSNLMPSHVVSNLTKHVSLLNQNTNFATKNNLQNDVFIKNSQISFKSKETAKESNNVLYDLAAIGVVAAPLLLSIAAATKLAKHQSSEDIFLPDGSYFMNTNEFKLSSKDITADGDDGIFKVKDTGINIDASKYDIADIEKGIYKNYDGSVDIDLLHNKYIDKINGIFIDPDDKISAVKVGNELVNINLPAFGSGYPTCPWDPRWNDSYLIGSSDQYRHEDINLTRSEYKSLFGYEPENDPHGIQAKGDILPDRSLSEKLNDFFSGKSDEKYDIFGRRFFEFKDTEGHLQKIALDDESYAIVKEFKIDGDAVPELAKFIDSLKLEQYITHNCPEYQDLVQPAYANVEEFINAISHSKDEISETLINHVDSEAHTGIAETINDSVSDTHSDGIFESIKSILSQIF